MLPIVKGYEQSARANDFATVVRLMLANNGQITSARYAVEQGDYSRTVQNIFERAEPGMMGGASPQWGGELSSYSQVAGAWSSSLRQSGAYDALLAAGVRVPLKSRVVLSTSSIVGDEVSEGESKPVGELVLNAADMPIRKFADIIVVSDELLALSNGAAESLISTELRNSVTAVVDDAFLSDLVSETTPTASGGDVLEDMATLLAAITSGANAKFFMVVGADTAKQIATLPGLNGPAFAGFGVNGGNVQGVTVIVSNQIANGTVLMVDASQLALAASELSLSASSEAVVTMSEDNSASLWQRNLKALRVERLCSWHLLRPEAVASLSGADYTTGVSP